MGIYVFGYMKFLHFVLLCSSSFHRNPTADRSRGLTFQMLSAFSQCNKYQRWLGLNVRTDVASAGSRGETYTHRLAGTLRRFLLYLALNGTWYFDKLCILSCFPCRASFLLDLPAEQEVISKTQLVSELFAWNFGIGVGVFLSHPLRLIVGKNPLGKIFASPLHHAFSEECLCQEERT